MVFDESLTSEIHSDEWDKVLVAIVLGADPNECGRYVHQPLYRAAQRERPDIIDALVALKADPNRLSQVTGVSKFLAPIHVARDPKTIECLVKNGAEVDFSDEAGQTALIKHVKGGHFQLVRLFLQLGANPNRPGKNGKTALHYAILNNVPEMVSLLVEHGADPSLDSTNARSPLDMAGDFYMRSNYKDRRLLDALHKSHRQDRTR